MHEFDVDLVLVVPFIGVVSLFRLLVILSFFYLLLPNLLGPELGFSLRAIRAVAS